MEMERVLEYQDHYAKETTNKITHAIMSGFHTGGVHWDTPPRKKVGCYVRSN